MNESELTLGALPATSRDAFGRFVRRLAELAGDELLSVSAFGGWIVEDPLYAGRLARSVVVLARVDLAMLDRLACEGLRFGKRGISAPLTMTPEYIQASRDTFPLELLEIQQLNRVVYGRDHFGGLQFQRSHVRLQSERDLKSELVQLRQGLLMAAGKRKALPYFCGNSAERVVRVLRGVLYLAGQKQPPLLSGDLVAKAALATGLSLNMLEKVARSDAAANFEAFQRFYGEIQSLAAYVDKLTDSASKNPVEL